MSISKQTAASCLPSRVIPRVSKACWKVPEKETACLGAAAFRYLVSEDSPFPPEPLFAHLESGGNIPLCWVLRRISAESDYLYLSELTSWRFPLCSFHPSQVCGPVLRCLLLQFPSSVFWGLSCLFSPLRISSNDPSSGYMGSSITLITHSLLLLSQLFIFY